MALLTDSHAWLAFLTLSLLEIVLGIDNLIFISILIGRLPLGRQRAARLGGLTLAMLTRLALLFAVVSLTHLVRPWLHLGDQVFSARDLVLLGGGLFLLGKSVLEMHRALEGAGEAGTAGPAGRLGTIVLQIALIDVVFSLDSVFTAVGLVKDFTIMAAAIVVAILVMMWVSKPIGAFVGRHPTIRILALSFLVLIGVALIGEGLHFEIPKGYLYFAIGFALAVELINMRLRRRNGPR